MQNKFLLKILLAVGSFSFGLNLIWENVQAPLYVGFLGFPQHFWLCFIASIGDAFAITVFYFIIAAIDRDVMWIRKLTGVDLLLGAAVGAIIAFAMEYFAVTFGKWNYLPLMPLLPLSPVGLSPFFQLLILTPATFFLTSLNLGKIKDINF